jgi:preprotein translocase subunit YajC
VSWLTLGWIALVLIGGWFLLVLPRRRLRDQQTAMRTDLNPGDEVITVGGIIGRIQVVEDDEVQLEIAPDVVVRVVRRGVAGRLSPDEPDEDEPVGDEES